MGDKDNYVYWSSFTHENWKMFIAATDDGVCYIGSPNKPFAELEQWVSKKLHKYNLIENETELLPYISDLQQYLRGEKREFTMQTDLRGTDFQLAIWKALQEIPYGETNSYSEIAEKINNPKAVRAVGAAIGANPVLMTVPCHRVIAKSGSLVGFRAGLEMKEFLLQLEQQI